MLHPTWQVTHEALAAALRGGTNTFTRDEWTAFGLTVTAQSYIAAGGAYASHDIHMHI